jgi:short subunit dehydrogenase-like uncharacterized protein
MTNAREFDLVLMGATGFTGGLVAGVLAERISAKQPLRWAIAGRNRQRLEAARKGLGDAADDIAIVVADSTSADDMNALAARTRAVCTTVGPYSNYGSELVAACAAHGTDYCDLTGEVPWVRRMIDAHHDTAEATGARIVHSCGFDCVPSDLGVWFLQREAIERFGAPLQHIKFRLKAARGAASGGTVASLMQVVREATASGEVRRVLRDPYGLNPAGERKGPDRGDLNFIRYDADIGAWIGPFVMAAINTRVVRRSNALLDYPYGADFRYDEAVITGAGISGSIKGLLLSSAMAGAVAGAVLPPVRYLMGKFLLPSPGEGPDADARESGYYKILFHGRTSDGQVLTATLSGQGDPGYGSTSRILAEAALCLAADKTGLPKPRRGGSLTPAAAMGDALLDRLRDHAGLTFEADT